MDFVAPDNSDWILLVQVSSEPKIRSSIKGERVMNGGVVKIVWQIGFANNSFTEFGLAPNDARRFKKVFGERMEFVFGETPLSRFPFIQATPTRLEEGNLKCLSSSAFNSRTNPKVFTHCTSHWQTPNEICHSLFTQKFLVGFVGHGLCPMPTKFEKSAWHGSPALLAGRCDVNAYPMEARRKSKNGQVLPSLCSAAPAYLKTKAERLLKLCEDGAVFLIFDGSAFTGECY